MNFGDRRDSHYSLLRNNKHQNSHLQRAWNKYGGEENFEFMILHELQKDEDIDQLEKDYINYYKDKGLAYNIGEGGKHCTNLGKHMSEETKQKIGTKNRQNMLGKTVPEDIRQKMSRSHKERCKKLSEEQRKQMVEPMLIKTRGKKWDDERRQKYSDMQKQRPNGSPYNIELIREIRRLHEQEGKGYTEIAQIVQIPRQAVYNIATYRRWKYAV